MASIRDVADLAGVSVGSVSRFLNGQKLKAVNMGKISSAITQLGYQENIRAKGLKNNRSFSVGLLMNSISSQFASEIVSSIEEIMEKNNYSLLLSGFKNDVQLIDQKIDYLLRYGVDGLIVFVSEQDWDGAERLQELDIPVIMINSPVKLEHIDVVQVEDQLSVKQATGSIYNQNHRKIGVIAAPQNDYTARQRLLGAEAFQEEHPDLELITYIGDYSKSSGYQGAKALTEAGATAILTMNYNMSRGVLEYINQQKKEGKEPFFLAHYDYTTELIELVENRLVICPQTKKIGELIGERLLNRMRDPGIKTELIQVENSVVTGKTSGQG